MTPGQIASYRAARAEHITASDVLDADTDPAHHVLAQLIIAMPTDIPMADYRVSGNNVSGQLSAGFHTDSSLRLRSIADLFGLDYTETAYNDGRLDLSARGVINGVNVRFWDNVPNPTLTKTLCICNCHNGGAA